MHQISDLKFHQHAQELEIIFQDARSVRLSYEFLRIHSPSAEVRGHGKGEGIIQTGKRGVTINKVEPVGQYAIQPTFSDGHNTGIYAFSYLQELAENQPKLWREYLDTLMDKGLQRDAPMAGTGETADRNHQAPSQSRGCGHCGDASDKSCKTASD